MSQTLTVQTERGTLLLTRCAGSESTKADRWRLSVSDVDHGEVAYLTRAQVLNLIRTCLQLLGPVRASLSTTDSDKMPVRLAFHLDPEEDVDAPYEWDKYWEVG